MEGFISTLKLFHPNRVHQNIIHPKVSKNVAEDNNNDTENVDNVAISNNNGQKNTKRIQPDNVKCNYCGVIIKFKKNLRRHILSAHSLGNEDGFNCLECNSSFGSQYHFDRHISSSNCLKNLNYDCKKCKKKFTSAEKLAVHLLKNCPKKFMCTYCLTFFRAKKDYLSHVSSHMEL